MPSIRETYRAPVGWTCCGESGAIFEANIFLIADGITYAIPLVPGSRGAELEFDIAGLRPLRTPY